MESTNVGEVVRHSSRNVIKEAEFEVYESYNAAASGEFLKFHVRNKDRIDSSLSVPYIARTVLEEAEKQGIGYEDVVLEIEFELRYEESKDLEELQKALEENVGEELQKLDKGNFGEDHWYLR